MLGTLLAVLAAQAAAAPSPPAPLPAPPPSIAAPQPRRLQQIFIAPSGESFRAAAEAPYPVADWFTRADADHDGKLTEAEFTADFLAFFARLDLDHDGVINGVELNRYEASMGSELQTSTFDGNWGMKHQDGDGESQPALAVGSFMGADSPQGAGRFDLLRIPEPVASMDTLLNGRITRQEAEDAAEYRFSVLDTRQRGYLLLTELPETFAQKHRIDGRARGHGGGRGKRGAHRGMRGGGMSGGDFGG